MTLGRWKKLETLRTRGHHVGDRVGWMGKMEMEEIKEAGDSGS